MIEHITNPLEYIECIIAFDPCDWSTDSRHATVYAIVFGWGDEAYTELQNKFNWNDEAVKRLKKFHEEWERMRDARELIRCKDCKHRPHKNKDGYIMPPRVQVGVYAWGEPEYDDDESCPYVCEDRWYSRIPNDEQYCDRAEPKEADE